MQFIFSVFFSVALITFPFVGHVQAESAEELGSAEKMSGVERNSLIKTNASSAVYYFGEDEARYVFPNEKVFYTWYDGFEDVITVSEELMSSIPLVDAVTYKPYSRLIKRIGEATVYGVIADGVLASLDDEAEAEAVFGEGWEDLVDDLPPELEPQYDFDEDIDELVEASTHLSYYFYTYVYDYDLMDEDIEELKSLIRDQLENPDDDTEVTTVAEIEELLEGYSISYDKSLIAATAFTIYESGFLTESGEDFASIQQGRTLKFVNQTPETVIVRELNNQWTTGEIDPGEKAVIVIDDEIGEYIFDLDSDDSMVGYLEVTEYWD